MSAANHLDLLGRRAKDRVTGFCGTVTSVSFDLFGCIQAVIHPELDKDGKMQDGRWLDVNRIELLGGERVMPVPKFTKPEFGATPETHTHGPADKPVRSEMP